MKKILILGASYGSLLGAKLALAGHAVTLVCLPAEVEAFNRDGARVRLPIKGREGLVEIDTRKAPGKLDAAGPGAVDPKHYDLVALAMQEPQYRSAGVRELASVVRPTASMMQSASAAPDVMALKAGTFSWS